MAISSRAGLRRWRVELLLVLAFALLSGFVIQEWTAQPSSRYLLTVAAVNDHTLELDRYEEILGVDRAEYHGHLYSDKAPYQPLLSAPLFQAYRWVGGDTFSTDGGRIDVGASRFFGLWWITLWSSVIPGIVLALVVRRVVAQTHPDLATPVAVAIVLGTTVFPFTSWLFGHVLAALWIMLAWAWLRRDNPTTRSVALAGVCLGLAIGTEYTVALIALVFLVRVLLSRRWAHVMVLSVGTGLATLPLLLYNYLVFEDPFEVSYQGHLSSFQGEGALGVYNLRLPRLGEVTKTLFGDRGLFVMTPIVACAVIGCVLSIVQRRQLRRDGGVALASLAIMLLVSTGIDGYGGHSPGPRYLIPALPLLATPLAEFWRRLPRPAAIAAGIGAFWMLAATITDPGITSTRRDAGRVWIEGLIGGDLGVNVVTGDSHRWLLYLTTLAGLGVLVLALRADRSSSTSTAGAR